MYQECYLLVIYYSGHTVPYKSPKYPAYSRSSTWKQWYFRDIYAFPCHIPRSALKLKSKYGVALFIETAHGHLGFASHSL
jgi:hypothetical protein